MLYQVPPIDFLVKVTYFPCLTTQHPYIYTPNPKYQVKLIKSNDKLYFFHITINIVSLLPQSQCLNIISQLLLHREKMGLTSPYTIIITIIINDTDVHFDLPLITITQTLKEIFKELCFLQVENTTLLIQAK
jgi:hypothetical protein